MQMCVDEFNAVVTDAQPKFQKLMTDIGLSQAFPDVGPGSNLDPDTVHRINMFISGGVDAAVSAFAFWYVYSAIRFFTLVINMAGAAVSELASFLGGVLGGIIAGAVGFVITDLIASAITGAIERKQLNEAIDALTELRDRVADPLLQAGTRMSGVAQAIRDGLYKLSDTIIIMRQGDTYQVITIGPPTTSVALVRQDFSDCLNSTVSASSASVGGHVTITQASPNYTVQVNLTNGTPRTTYHFFLKCKYILGDLTTDANGVGTGNFHFPIADVQNSWAFDMYPDGAPLGNKFQSEPVHMAH